MGKSKQILSAEINVDDKSSKQLDTISKSVQKMNNELMRMSVQMEKMRKQGNKKTKIDIDTKPAQTNVEKLKKAMDSLENHAKTIAGKIKGSFSKMSISPANMYYGAIGGLAAGYVGKQAFDSTVGAAAKYEQNAQVVQSMMPNKDMANRYLSYIDQKAVSSPLLNSQDMLEHGQRFLATTQNEGKLHKMWNQTEKLIARNPNKAMGGGAEGAALAYDEFMNGTDITSLVTRFNFSRKELNGMKNLPLDEKLKAFDKFLAKNKLTDQLVQDMGNTTLGVWNQLSELTQSTMRKMGGPANKILGDFLKKINNGLNAEKTNKIVKFGQDMLAGIATSFVSVTQSIGGWIERIVNNPEFEKLNTIEEKFTFVLGEVKTSFNGWYEKTGKQTMTDIATGLTDSLVKGIENNIGNIAGVSLKIGGAIAKGIVDGITKDPVASTLIGAFVGGMIGGPVGAGIGAVSGLVISGTRNSIENGMPLPQGDGMYITLPEDPVNAQPPTPPKPKHFLNKDYLFPFNTTELPKKRAIGQPKVPRNNYPVMLDEGERVQTKQQVMQQDNAGTGNTYSFGDIHLHGVGGDLEKAADQLFTIFTRKIKLAGGNM